MLSNLIKKVIGSLHLMNFPLLILYLSIIVWSTIPFRHIRKKYFYFFYSIALIDPLTSYLRQLFHSSSNFFFIPLGFLSLVSLYEKQIIKKNKIYIILLFIILCLINIKINLYVFLFLTGLVYFSILLKLVSDFVILIYKEKLFNIFSAVLVLNAVTEVFSFLHIYTGSTNGYFYFYTLLIFQIVIGFFFWIFKEDNPKLLIKLR